MTYFSCTDITESPGSEWCSTKVDSEGFHVSGGGYYGFCATDCKMDSYLHLNLGTHGMKAPKTCSVVLVAGSALHDLQSVKATVKSLAHQMTKTPYIMVLLVDNPNIKLDTSSHPMDPAMVSCQLHTPYNTIPYHTILTRYRWISRRLAHFTPEKQPFNISAKESPTQASKSSDKGRLTNKRQMFVPTPGR